MSLIMETSRHLFAEPHPQLLIPEASFGRAPAPEVLAQVVAVLLLLVAWVAMVWVVSSGLVGTTEEPPAPVQIEVRQSPYLSA